MNNIFLQQVLDVLLISTDEIRTVLSDYTDQLDELCKPDRVAHLQKVIKDNEHIIQELFVKIEGDSITGGRSLLQQALEVIEKQQNGLQWYRDEHPGCVDFSDAECDEEVAKVIASLEAEIVKIEGGAAIDNTLLQQALDALQDSFGLVGYDFKRLDVYAGRTKI